MLPLCRNHYIEGSFGNERDGWEWNVFDRLEDGHLTNNPCEGGNNRLRKRVGVDHPGFYRLCGTLVNEFDNVGAEQSYLRLATSLAERMSEP